MDCKKVYGVKPDTKKPKYGNYSHGICPKCEWFNFACIDIQLELSKLKSQRPIDIQWGKKCAKLVHQLLAVKRIWSYMMGNKSLRIRFAE